MPFVIWVAFRYGRLNRPASQEVQQRIAELTAEAEENIGGVRVVKAFAQEERQCGASTARSSRVFDQSMVSTRLRALLQPADRVPPPARTRGAAVRGRPPGDQRLAHVGDFVAFYGYVLMLMSPMRMLGMALGMAQRAVASRRARVRGARPRAAPDGAGRAHAAAERAAAAWSCAT